MEDFGVIDPDSIEDAIARGAYSALSKVLFEMTPEDAIAEVTASGLRGRGGAGFPAGIKWESGRKARARPKFVAVNSHEGEPNVYKDRRIHEGDPHKILEGMLIASVVCGAERAYNYIGGEYPWPSSGSAKRLPTPSGWVSLARTFSAAVRTSKCECGPAAAPTSAARGRR